jgi:hypothetical protein
MKKWIMKAVIQKTISFLPFSNKINYVFQKYITKGVFLSDLYFTDRLEHAREHLRAFKKYNGKSFPRSSLEIGTGWYPVVPISFFLSGTDKIYSVDISFLTSKERIKITLLKFIDFNLKFKLIDYLDIIPERFAIVEKILKEFESLSLDEILDRLNIIYLIGDARKLSLPDDSIDLINSNNTFEHIYPQILKPILKEFKRVVRKENGVMSHFIDMSDHFAHFDKSINIYNFLKFSEKQWKYIDNSIQPQSRLRIYDYKEIYTELKIPITEESSRPGNTDELKTIQLNERYSSMLLTEVAKSHCHFISLMKF